LLARHQIYVPVLPRQAFFDHGEAHLLDANREIVIVQSEHRESPPVEKHIHEAAFAKLVMWGMTPFAKSAIERNALS
jgi:hypothetical protein